MTSYSVDGLRRVQSFGATDRAEMCDARDQRCRADVVILLIRLPQEHHRTTAPVGAFVAAAGSVPVVSFVLQKTWVF